MTNNLGQDVAVDLSCHYHRGLRIMRGNMVPAPELERHRLRKTKIVATVGPATSSPERLRELMLAGVNVFRLNFSHGTQREHAQSVRRIRRLGSQLGCAVGILQDLQGPKIRTGHLVGSAAVHLATGAELVLTSEDIPGTADRVSVDYLDLPRQVRAGEQILLADGTIELRVKAATEQDVVTEVVRGGVLGEHKGVNLPGIELPIPALTKKDIQDLEFGVGLGVDWVALSFVQRPEDLHMAKELLAGWNSDIPVLAKIETAQAVRNLETIVQASDGVMVARGDMGVELGPERVPLIQKRLIRLANEYRIPVITATQMLESMISSPVPTRAEVSDVANAILDGTHAVMLSGETAIGQYPVEAVQAMARIADEVEAAEGGFPPIARHVETPAQSLARAAGTLAGELGAQALVLYTTSGYAPQLLSREAPSVPIFAYTASRTVYHRLAFWFGIFPLLTRHTDDTDRLIGSLEADLVKRGVVSPGATIVFVRLAPPEAPDRPNLITARTVPLAPPPAMR
jgi:pyruvate kinase